MSEDKNRDSEGRGGERYKGLSLGMRMGMGIGRWRWAEGGRRRRLSLCPGCHLTHKKPVAITLLVSWLLF